MIKEKKNNPLNDFQLLKLKALYSQLKASELFADELSKFCIKLAVMSNQKLAGVLKKLYVEKPLNMMQANEIIARMDKYTINELIILLSQMQPECDLIKKHKKKDWDDLGELWDLIFYYLDEYESGNINNFFRDMVETEFDRVVKDIDKFGWKKPSSLNFKKLKKDIKEEASKKGNGRFDLNIKDKTKQDRLKDSQVELMNKVKKAQMVGILTQNANVANNYTTLAFAQHSHEDRRLLRTETDYVVNEVESEVYEKMGIRYYFFLSSGDDKVCGTCDEMDGMRFLYSDKQVGKNYPPLHPNCRCCIIPDTDELTYRKRKAKQ